MTTPFDRLTSRFLESVARTLGLLLPSGAIGVGVYYFNQDLTFQEHLMVLGIIATLIFSLVGYSVFHPALYKRFGKISLFIFVTWTLIVTVARVASFFDLINSDEARYVNTVTALIASLFLSYIALWRPWLGGLIRYLFTESEDESKE